jgi:hypothetical protein
MQMHGRIFICQNGHDLCEQCYRALKGRIVCPQCKCHYTYAKSDEPTRNRALERILQESTLPCPFASNGCKQSELSGNERKAHAKQCKHRLYKCPFGVCHATSDSIANAIAHNVGCNMGGDLSQMTKHAKDAHAIESFEAKDNEFNFELDDMSEGEGHWRMFLKSQQDNCVFLMGFKNSDNAISLCARAIIPSQVGQTYNIAIYLPNQSAIHFQSKLRAIDEPLGTEAKHDGECLLIDARAVSLMKEHKHEQTTIMKITL